MGDFRLTAPTIPSALLIGLALIAAAGGLVAERRAGASSALVFYVAVALVGCGVVYLAGAHAVGDGQGAGDLLARAARRGADRRRDAVDRAGRIASRAWRRVLVIAALAGGVLWSNALAYHDVTLAPRARLAELQHIGGLVAGKGPTFVNEYEVYADRHFLREGAPVEPAEYRTVTLPLRDGVVADQERLGRPRLVPALDARALPLDRHRALAGGKPAAVDLSPGLAGPLLPALAAPGATPRDASSSTSRWANRTRCPTAARPRTGRTSRCARSTPWRVPPCSADRSARPAGAAPRTPAARLPAPRADRRARRPDAVAGALAPRSRRTHADADDARARRPATSTWPAPDRTNCGSAAASPAASKSASTASTSATVRNQLSAFERLRPGRRSVPRTPACTTIGLTYPRAEPRARQRLGRVHLRSSAIALAATAAPAAAN